MHSNCHECCRLERVLLPTILLGLGWISLGFAEDFSGQTSFVLEMLVEDLYTVNFEAAADGVSCRKRARINFSGSFVHATSDRQEIGASTSGGLPCRSSNLDSDDQHHVHDKGEPASATGRCSAWDTHLPASDKIFFLVFESDAFAITGSGSRVAPPRT